MTKPSLKTEATLRVADVMRLLDVQRSTVYNMLKSGRLQGIRVGQGGRNWRISESEVRRYMASGGQAA